MSVGKKNSRPASTPKNIASASMSQIKSMSSASGTGLRNARARLASSGTNVATGSQPNTNGAMNSALSAQPVRDSGSSVRPGTERISVNAGKHAERRSFWSMMRTCAVALGPKSAGN
eukprot:Amastigsp_a676512_8.p3 type:complete len:117 gc:universal Amastigsp_a676512_8:1086-736(-)